MVKYLWHEILECVHTDPVWLPGLCIQELISVLDVYIFLSVLMSSALRFILAVAY